MRRNGLGPPENDAAREASPTCPGTASKGLAKTHTRQGKRITGDRHLGLYAAGWRDGFSAGAADALRVAGRHLPPETWHVVEALADQYDLAAGDA
jgi:hypothetical protein